MGEENAANRAGSRGFQGWAVVSVEDASHKGRTVKDTPILANPYHADIELPLPSDAERRKTEGTDHALELATAAEWLDRPRASVD